MKRLAIIVLSAFIASALFASHLPAIERAIKVKLRESERPDARISEEATLYTSSHALVIGINNYTEGWPRLSEAVHDAELVAEALKEKGFDVVLKTNLNSMELEQAFREFFIFKGEDPNARLFVWFAGHGHTLDGEGFLIPADAPLPGKGALFKYKALSLRRFGEYVRLARSKHALAVFDSCFSGTIFDTQRTSPPPAITRATTLPVRQFLSSGDSNQTVSDDGRFRKLFIRAVRGEERADANNDGYMTGSELGLFLTDRLTNLTESRQTPRYGKLRDEEWDRGDFVFQVVSSGPPSQTSAQYDRLQEERKRLEQERRELDRLRTEIERKKIEAERAGLEEEREKLKVASVPVEPRNTTASSIVEVKRDGIYVAYANGIVRDTKTGLEWVAGPDRDMTWNEARSWVESLNLDDGGWRLPTGNELETLYKIGVGSRNMTPLLKTTGWWVWSGETKDPWYEDPSAKNFRFNNGKVAWGDQKLASQGGRAFAVRSRSDG